jgi:hypothetical protein
MSQEAFVIFHPNGYTVYEPRDCLTERHVKGNFGNFRYIPDDLDGPPSMCDPTHYCVWGSAVSVQGKFIYVSQPRQSRVLIIDMEQSLNPIQVSVVHTSWM